MNEEILNGKVFQYLHHNQNVGSMITLRTKTDFALRSECVNTLAKEVCLQVACNQINDIDELLKSKFIKDDTRTIQDLVNECKSQIGETLVVDSVYCTSV